jgi:hypothetical protein
MAVVVAGCAAQQRSQMAADAQTKLRGMTKEQVLSCMGPPSRKMAEGATEVWSYSSGDGHTSTSGSASTLITGALDYEATTTRRFCTVDVVMTDGLVSRLNYSGPTGGLLTPGEQCGFAVQNCVRQNQIASSR